MKIDHLNKDKECVNKMPRKKKIKKALGCNVPDIKTALNNIKSYENCDDLYLQGFKYADEEEDSHVVHNSQQKINKIFSDISFKKDKRNTLSCVALDEDHLKENALDYSHCKDVKLKNKKKIN